MDRKICVNVVAGNRRHTYFQNERLVFNFMDGYKLSQLIHVVNVDLFL